MLLGRAAERARLDGVLAGARAGRGGALVVRGDAGIGKTALLDDLGARATDCVVLRAHGVQAETTLAYSGLHELLGPLLGALDAMAGPHAEALRRGLGLGERAQADLYLAYAGVLQLLADRAEHAPVLCLIDDAHWLDSVSAEGFGFVARRLGAERVAMVFAAREHDGGALDLHALDSLPLAGLRGDDALALLEAGRPLAGGVAEALIADTAGNPLALQEIPALLTADQRAGEEPLDEPVVVGPNVERAFLSRAGELSPVARHVLLLAAVSASPRADVIARAAPGAADGLDEAEATGLVRVRGTAVEFRHPLVRSAIHSAATSGEKRAAHAALADALAGDPDDRDLWHRAAAAIGCDDALAAALDTAAERAMLRCLVDEQQLRERAARLTHDPPARAERLLRAAVAAHGGGRSERAVALLAEGLELTMDPLIRADLLEARLVVADGQGTAAGQAQTALAHAAAIATADPTRSRRLLCRVWMQACEQLDVAQAQRLAAAVPEADPDDLALAARARHGLLEASGAALAAARRGAGAELAEAVACAEPLLVLGDETAARGVLEHALAQATARGSTLTLIRALCVASELDLRGGHVAQAHVAAERAVELAREERLPDGIGKALAARASVGAVLGDPATRTTVEAAAASAARALDRVSEMRALDALGRLELGSGEAGAAVAAFEVVEATMPIAAPAGHLRWRPDLIEALARLDRPTDAAAVLERFADQAARHRTAWAEATLARCRALLGAPGEFAAAAALARRVSPFEAARTELAWGASLRRAGHRTEARTHLQAALAGFERLGAAGWAARAGDELRASGALVRQRDPALVQRLTSRELEIALLAAQGATNREIGARLFLSAKTVEVHLGRVYRKLGLRSRTELARSVPAA